MSASSAGRWTSSHTTNPRPGSRSTACPASRRSVEVDGDTLTVDHPQIRWDDPIGFLKSFRGKAHADVSILVPRDAGITLGVVSAGALLSGTNRGATLNTVSGDLVVDGVAGDVTVNAVSGATTIRDLDGALDGAHRLR